MGTDARSRLAHPVGTVVAAVLSALLFVLAVTSGEAPAEDTGAIDTNGLTPDAAPKFGYPFCRVDVTDLGPAGAFVAVALLNDLTTVWAVAAYSSSQVTVPIDLVRGMGQAALPAGAAPQSVTIYGTEALLDLSAGCAWQAG